METAELKKRWLDYFGSKGHEIVPSASLISPDPTVLFTIAGMVPFIPYLTGLVPAPYRRATSVQKCIRTNDIEEVGRTPRHGTFFQMNGNFSFGDYFKEGAITYAWELLTSAESAGGYGFDEKDLWVTVYEDDDEAFDLWRKVTGIPETRIQRLGKDTNYWSTGQPGPAGPCSEIFFDRGKSYGIDGGPATDDDRYVEIWNLVFMQYAIENVRSKLDFDIIGELPNKNIDTGMGLERVAFIKQGVENMYEIDQVRPVLDVASELSGKKYGANHEDDVRMRVVADHIRSSLMLISDGVTPGNDGREYILRRLMRRSSVAMRLLGVEDATFPALFSASKDAMKSAYPEVEADWSRISGVAYAEEESFLKTLSSGIKILDLAITDVKASKSKSVPANTAFLLHDTHGFPIEITEEIVADSGLALDREKFNELMLEQRTRAKQDAKAKKAAKASLEIYKDFRGKGETVFTGYTDLETETTVLGLLVDGQPTPIAKIGDEVEVITSSTSLYAESGGQVADLGTITGDGVTLEVLDVQKPVPGLVSHTAKVVSGEVRIGQDVVTRVDPINRNAAAKAHSATHLIHAALRDTLGPTATQAGSLNRAGYMRLDFNWNKPLSGATRSEIEEIANNAISADYSTVTKVMALGDAKALGAMALFGEKYGDQVRVVEIGGDWSRELCAGTHVERSSQIGLINLISESSVGSSARRIESLVGVDAFKEFAAERLIVSSLGSMLKSPKDKIENRVEELLESLKQAKKQIADLQFMQLQSKLPELVSNAYDVKYGKTVLANVGSAPSADDLRRLALDTHNALGDGVVVLLAEVEGKPQIVAAVSDHAQSMGLKAGDIVRIGATTLGGGGGGKPNFAQGGGVDVSAISNALVEISKLIGISS
ncbi:MAG: alanine--tRNA ligase [Microbacteriaceae bacterium]|nr:alanine--tRNA ligase [Microbacteriaceae bacterium]